MPPSLFYVPLGNIVSPSSRHSGSRSDVPRRPPPMTSLRRSQRETNDVPMPALPAEVQSEVGGGFAERDRRPRPVACSCGYAPEAEARIDHRDVRAVAETVASVHAALGPDGVRDPERACRRTRNERLSPLAFFRSLPRVLSLPSRP